MFRKLIFMSFATLLGCAGFSQCVNAQALVSNEGGYDPLGMRYGALVFYPSLSSGFEYTDNVNFSNGNEDGDIALSFLPSLRIESDWERHAWALNLSSSHIHYFDSSPQNLSEAGIETSLRIDITNSTKMLVEGGYKFGAESRGSIDIDALAIERPTEHNFFLANELSQQFNRFGVSLRTAFNLYTFDNVDLLGGGTQNNSDRDYYEVSSTLRLGYDVSPATQVYSTIGYAVQNYQDPVDDDGFNRDSDGFAIALGVEYTPSPIWRYQASIGYAYEEFSDDQLDGIDAALVSFLVQWSPSEFTRASVGFGTALGETNFAGASGSVDYTLNARLEHEFDYDMAGYAEFKYQLSDLDNTSITDKTYNLELGIEYAIDQHTALIGYYTHEIYVGNASEYVVNTIGMQIQYSR